VKNNYKKEQEVNFVGMTLGEFIDYYNENTPAAMPRATKNALKEFQTSHANIFDESGLWTIDKHRRRVMDWLSSYHAEA
jgi:hypothetical protein